MSDDVDLAHELTRLVESTPGVTEVYPAGPALVLGVLADRPRVALTRSGDTLRVDAVIGVGADFAVPDTLRAVGDALRARLAAAGGETTVAVRASRIQ